MLEKLENEYISKIESINSGMMPEWEKIEENEKQGIIDLFEKWQKSVKNAFGRIKTNQKTLKDLVLNETKLISKGKFDFETCQLDLKQIQLDLLDLCKLETVDDKVEIISNTRLIIRSFKEFLNSFKAFEKARASFNANDLKTYWTNVNQMLVHQSKAILRCAFYVHENAKLYRASIGLPPMYILESDEYDTKNVPNVRIETLFEYVYVCFNQIKVNIQMEKNSATSSPNGSSTSSMSKREKRLLSRKKSNTKLKCFKLILICLMRLVQVGVIVRENFVMKLVRYEKGFNENGAVDVDIYSHFIFNQQKLIFNNLKQIIMN